MPPLSRVFVVATVFLLCFSVSPPKRSHFSQSCSSKFQGFKKNVIVISLDGVRVQEAFVGHNRTLLPDNIGGPLLNAFELGTSLGNPETGTTFTSHPLAISRPAYASIHLGKVHEGCIGNDDETCPPISGDTFYTHYAKLLSAQDSDVENSLKKGISHEIPTWQRVAFFGSWKPMRATVATDGDEEYLYINTDLNHLKPENWIDQEFVTDMNERMREAVHERAVFREQVVAEVPNKLHRWERYFDDSRPDDITWDLAMQFLEERRPKLMGIGLVDSDTWAHWEDYRQYVSAVQRQNRMLLSLLSKLSSMGSYGRDTLVFVFSDHGRSRRFFHWHGDLTILKESSSESLGHIAGLLELAKTVPGMRSRVNHILKEVGRSSKESFFTVFNSDSVLPESGEFGFANIRPTIDLALSGISCDTCSGRAIPELLGCQAS